MPRRLAAAGIVAVVSLAVPAPAALGHAAFLESTPAPGARVESTPPVVALDFTEPLNRGLSRAKLFAVPSGERVSASSQVAAGKELVLRPAGPLRTGAYRVEWHTVSTRDGHALEGSFGFGVRAAAAGGEHQVEQSPLARNGWLLIGLRGLFYAALFFFAGGVLLSALFGGPQLASWLVPDRLRATLADDGVDPEGLVARHSARTFDAGLLALALGAAVALEEAADAGGGFSLHNTSDYLLTNSAGVARVATVVGLALAVLGARRLRAGPALACVFVFLTIALSGHANSAEQRLLAVLTDWVHLVAGALWVGGIAQIAAAWLPQLGRSSGELRRSVMRLVLERFGRVALPAFLLVASTGLVNALTELGRVSALWDSGYGRVLAVKIALVAMIAAASYLHALRLRPRLLAANPHPPPPRERRHWRLLRAEPLLGLGVVFAAATLVAFPLPPRQLKESAEAEAGGKPPCSPCPLPRPRADELGVAEQAGSSILAGWLRRSEKGLRGELRLLGPNREPRRAKPRISGATLNSCGPGCWRFRLGARPAILAVSVREKGRPYTAHLPARWLPGASGRARRILDRAQATMRGLRSMRESERLTSGPGSFAATEYRLEAPDRFSYTTSGGAQSVVLGTRQWSRAPGQPWREDRYGGGGPGFTTRSWFTWTSYAQEVRLLGVVHGGGRSLARLALMSPGTPLWFRLTVDLSTLRVTRVRMIAGAHFMSQRLYAFNQPLRIEAPRP